MFGPTLSASGFTICWISGSSLSMKARCIAKLPIPAQKMAMMAISIGLQMGQPGWKCKKLSGYTIGRASSRERECQYVKISVVAEPLTQKKEHTHQHQ